MKKILKLYFFGVGLGLKSLFKLKKINLRILEMILLPLNYWRCIETPMVLNGLNPQKKDKILDIGSPKLLSLFLSKKFDLKVISSDVNNYFISYCKDFVNVLNINKNYSQKIIDAQKINLKDNSIDKIYAISVFEHIPNKGDTLAIKEVKRILKKGGIFILTIPYGDKFEIEYKNPKNFYYSKDINSDLKNNKNFYQRRYDEKSLYDRIILPSKMKLIDKKYVGERSKLLSKFSFPFFSFINIFLSKINHTLPSKNLKEIKNPCMVYLEFKK